MQKVKCEVALGGDVRACVPKTVTVPELVVLEAVHGHGSIMNVQAAGMDKRSHQDELERLHRIYGGAGAEDENIVARLFPGYAPKLPVKLSEIGRAESGEDDKPSRQPKKKKTSKKAAAKAASGEGDSNPEKGGEGNEGDSNPEKGGENDNDALS